MTGKRAARTLAAVAALVALWELGTRLLAVPVYILPPPSAVLLAFQRTWWLQAQHLGITTGTTLIGLALAIVAGTGLALGAVYVRTIRALILPALAAFNGIPKVAIAPLFVIWFGLGDEPKILLAFLMGLFPIFVGAAAGLGEIEPDYLDLARLSGGTEQRIFWKVRLMHALPYLTDAVKIAFPLALVGSVVGEFIGGNRGIGYLILSGQFNLDTPLVFACLLGITLITSLGTGLVVWLESVSLVWRPSRRRDAPDTAPPRITAA